jgi:chemotaxis family two-component system response regulator Rcp1
VNGENGVFRIAVVEDNPGDVYLFRRALREMGVAAELTVYTDGASASKAFSAINKTSDTFLPDLLVLDLSLPKLEGIDVLKVVRTLYRFHDIPVIVLTSSEAPSDLQSAIGLGVTRYLSKPTELQDYLETVGQGVKDLLPGR